MVDTIGAGDYFTSGFLYAYLMGCSLQQCAAVGCQAGSEAVQTKGAILSDAAWQRLRSNVAAVVGAAATRKAANGAAAGGVAADVAAEGDTQPVLVTAA